MIHSDTMIKFIDDEMGYGIFATKLIPKGTISYVQDELETQVNPQHFKSLKPEMQALVEKYAFTDQRGVHIVSWDLAKYVNHSCNPNSISTGYGFEIALRDIHPGEELTDEYGLFNPTTKMSCSCGSKICRGSIAPQDVDDLYLDWDRKIRSAFSRFFSIDQPLLGLVDFETMESLTGYMNKSMPYKSVLELQYPVFQSTKAD